MNMIAQTTTIVKQCAWCRKFLGFPSRILSLIKQPHVISHGICWDCQKQQLALLSKNARMRYEVEDQNQTQMQMEKVAI